MPVELKSINVLENWLVVILLRGKEAQRSGEGVVRSLQGGLTSIVSKQVNNMVSSDILDHCGCILSPVA